MTRSKDKALDVAEYTLGAPLFIAVSALTAVVMAVGFGAVTMIQRVRG